MHVDLSGDLILEVNNKPVTDVHDVLNEVGLEVGKTLSFKIQRHQQGDIYNMALVTAPEIR